MLNWLGSRMPGIALLALLLGVPALAVPASAQIVHNPPADSVSIIVFPQRDFVSASGYAADDRVIVRVIHDPAVFPGATGGTTDPVNWISPQGDPAAAPGAPFPGIVEVNHPGGACWFGQTPDIRPGDRVQIEVMAGTHAGRIDETTVANITVKRPVLEVVDVDSFVVVHGSAQDAFGLVPGNPLDVTLLEQRIVAPGSQFEVNGRRTLRAVAAPATADGVLAYDPIDALTNPFGLNWTARYAGLSAADIELALGAESRSMWLGNAVLPAAEATIYEVGALVAAGPAAPCTAPLEVLPPPPGSELEPPTAPSNLQASISFSNTVTLTWDASTDNVGVTAYGIYRNGQAIFTVSNPDGAVDPPTTFVDRNTPPGTYTFQVRAFDEVGNASAYSNEAGPVVAVQQLDANTFPLNEPPVLPINIIAFPSRDFISPSGYQNTDQVTVQILREDPAGNLVVVSSATGILPDGEGFAEVNHPGGACWEGVTPEIRAGDVVRTIAYNPANIGPGNPDGIRSIDQTHIAAVTAFKPVIVANDDPLTLLANEGIVEVHGTATGPDGRPLPIDQIEQRMIATRDRYDFNGRRSMRAGGGADGTLSYDAVDNPLGVKWTARYVGLDADDVARMAGGTSLSTGRVFPGADTRIHWLGANPLLLNEATIFENAPDGNPPGPAGPACFRPLEAADVTPPSAPGFLNATANPAASELQLDWSPSSDDWSVAGYRIYQDGVAIANAGPDATGHLLHNVAAGAHVYEVRAYDNASPLGPGADIIAQISSGLGNLYGNLSAPSNAVNSTQPDVTAPSVPQNLLVLAGDGTAALEWSASSDDVGVTEYHVYRDAVLVATVAAPATTWLDSPLATGAYVYTVDAADAAGNVSAQSAPVTADVVSTADVNAPSVPTGVSASTSPDIHGRSIVVSWTAATDDVGVAGYSVFRGATKIADVNGSTLSYTDANLAAGTYEYQVEAFDSANNRSGLSAGASAVVANDPPASGHSLIVFPARDFVSASGYSVENGPYRFTVFRGAQVYQSDTLSVNAADALGVPTNGTGTVEVNHPGGTCWLGVTPNIRPGDVVRITDAHGVADQTTVSDMTCGLPIATSASTIVVRGEARTAAGQPLPLGELEHRFIADVRTQGRFDLNGRRDLRSSTDGSLAYDAPGSTHWTATYTGLSVADMLRITGGTGPDGTVYGASESRAVWLGRLPLALLELDIHETGPLVAGGPAGPECTAPAEAPAPGAALAPAALAFGTSQLATPPQNVVLTNTGTSLLTVRSAYISGVNAGDFSISAGGGSFTLAPAASRTLSVVFNPQALGLRQAYVAVSCDAANTTDLAVALTGTGASAVAPPAPGAPTQGLSTGGALTVFTGTSLGNSTLPVQISWAPSASPLVSSYQLQVSVNSTAWVDVAPQPGIATTITMPLAMGTSTAVKSYQFRVRALNLAVPGAWATGTRFGLTPIDETNTSQLSYGGTWTSQTLAGTYGGTQRFASTNRDKVQLNKKATFSIPGAIAWITRKGPDCGRANVSLDGGAPVTVDLYAPVQQLAAIPFAVNVGANAQHQLVVQVLGTRNAASSGTRVATDAFIQLNGAAGTTPALAQPVEPEPVGPVSGRLEFAPVAPNPSIGEAAFAFSLPREGRVHLAVMDVQGRLVRELANGPRAAGAYRIVWDGRDARGGSTGAGVYFAVLRFDDRSIVRRVVRMR